MPAPLMPGANGFYMLRFKLPDGEHLAGGNSIRATTPDQLAFVYNEFRSHIRQNPDAEIDPATFLTQFNTREELDAALAAGDAELRAADPNRKLASDLPLDTPQRLLTDPEIARFLKSQQAAGSADAPTAAPATLKAAGQPVPVPAPGQPTSPEPKTMSDGTLVHGTLPPKPASPTAAPAMPGLQPPNAVSAAAGVPQPQKQA